jgi:hypothetical protein
MTKDRRRKAAIREQQRSTGCSYLEVRRQDTRLTASPPAADTAINPVERVNILPPLSNWTRPLYCRWWADLQEQHGPLIALHINQGEGWWELDDLAREVAGALQDQPADERGLWVHMWDLRYTVTKGGHLADIAAKLEEAGALSRLTVRSVPEASSCSHASCRRRRGEPPQARRPEAAARRAAGITHHGGTARLPFTPGLSLNEVMEKEPRLNYFGFGVYNERNTTTQQRQQKLQSGRDELRCREHHVIRVRDWLLGNIAPIKTPKVSSYGMKHMVEKAIGEYVANGELIAAALMAGYPTGRPHGPNAIFGMSQRDINRARG